MLSNFIEITLQHGCSPVNMLQYVQNSFLQEHLRGAAFEFYYKINSFIVAFRVF